MPTIHRSDLSNSSIVLLLLLAIIGFMLLFILPVELAPGSSTGQSSAVIGAMFLLTPAIFSFIKRSAIDSSPPSWFVAHVLMSLIGSFFIALHVSSANLFTPPGFVFLLLLILLLQGAFLRVKLTRKLSTLFAHSSQVSGFVSLTAENKLQLQSVILAKENLLKRLDPSQQEALFSPALKHWVRHPLKSIHYQWLADKEADLIGNKKSIGFVLSWSRRFHLFIALLFFFGLLSHIIIVLFFAGYASNGGEIEWWYISAWGR